jgi:hypothetical protein
MHEPTIRAAFPSWAHYNRRLRDAVEGLTVEQLAIRPAPDRWPLWATIGHAACQRVFWLCDFAGEPGAAESPFPDAGDNCPGDDDLEHAWDGPSLAGALDETFAIVERVLDTWTLPMLAETINDGEGDRVHTRGWVLQRVLAHDVAHIAEVNEVLGGAGLPQIDIW